ncbi:3'-5' exonuclease [Paenibacillus tundrae]|uniref:DNA polymerase III alpha subunit (Gram-positive type) n=1 Tax=Paenibacillus tundrae TaxID=528187 RepID=A0ABT9WAD1_9BACL|nr:3'-5' exonuclease [Paenibacillus tundrae]MDQ0170176.1 DNA polymerase III alpha subunit (gram-positive type) [Paenibacillus tundrae]
MKTTFLNDTYTIEDLHVSPLQGQTYCIFDLEGTGILPDRESVTQFGAMLYNNRDQLYETFSTLSRAEKPIPQAVAQLTGITNEDMITAPSFIEAFQAFTDFIGDRVLVTQAGYEYDLPILRRHCEQYGLPMFNNAVLDTKVMFTYIHSEITEVISTDFLIQYYNLDTEGIQRHDALADCTIIALIFERILDEYRALELNHFTADTARSMKRFVIPEMYLNDN